MIHLSLNKGESMRIYEYREVIKILKLNGWFYVRTNGSHEIYKHLDGRSCPIKCTEKIIPKGTLSKISKITGIKFD